MSLPYNYRQLMAPVDDTITKDQAWEMRMLNTKEGVERLQVRLEEERKTELANIIFTKTGGNSVIKSIITDTGKIIAGNSLSIDTKKGIIKYNNKEISLKQVTLTDEASLKYLLALAPKYYRLKKKWKVDRDKEMKSKSFSSVADPNVNMEKFIEFLSGKAGVGQTAVHITHHQLAMAANIKYNAKESYWIHDHNKSDGKPSFAGKKDQDGEWISETLSAFVNAYVDIAADPYVFDMNAGNQTANMILMLVRSGASMPWITKFVSQPIIKDYIQAQRVNESSFNKAVDGEISKEKLVESLVTTEGADYTVKNSKYWEDKFGDSKYEKQEEDEKKGPRDFIYKNNETIDAEIEKLFNAYHVSTDEERKKLLIVEKNKLDTRAYQLNEQRWRRIKELKDNGLFSEEKIGQYILSNTLKTKEFDETSDVKSIESFDIIAPDVYNEVQHYMLDMFLEYQRQSKDFQMMIRATAADTRGAQKNMDDNKAWLKEVEEVKFKDRFTNLNKIYEESVISEVHKAVVESVKMFKPLYYFESDPVISKAKQELIDIIEGSMPLTKDAKSKLASTINNDLITALVTMDFNETEDGKKVIDRFSPKLVFEELFIKSENNTYINRNGESAPLSEIIYELNTITNSQKRKISKEASVRSLWGLRGNRLIKSLIGFKSDTEYTSYGELKEQSEIGSTPEFQTIQFKAIKLDVLKDNQLRNEFIKIKEYDELKGTKLFDDLIRFSFNQSGVQHNSPITFSNLIPNEIVVELLREKFDKFNNLTEDVKKDVLESFKMQFLQRTIEFTPTMRTGKKGLKFIIADSNTLKFSRFVKTTYSPEKGFRKTAISPKEKNIGAKFHHLTITKPNINVQGDVTSYSPLDPKSNKGMIRGHGRFFMGYDLSLDPADGPLKVRKQEEWEDYYEGKIAELKDDEMYIFGANDRGLHGAGGAGDAMDKHRTLAQVSVLPDGTVEKWAVKGETGFMQGTMGNSWGLVTVQGKPGRKDKTNRMPEKEIIDGIKKVYEHLNEHPYTKGYVAYSNELNEKSLNGYTGEEMINLFNLAGPIPTNAIFSKTWFDTGLLDRSETIVDEGVDPSSTVETESVPVREQIIDGVEVIRNSITKAEQLELFDILKPYLEEQGAVTNMGWDANIMIGLGLRWDYVENNPNLEVLYIPNLIDPGSRSKYGYYEASINGKPLGPISIRLRELMTKATGVDTTNYDGAIINLYEVDTAISTHSDGNESKDAINYPVLVTNIGGDGNFVISPGYKETQGIGKEKAIHLSPGDSYIFGLQGKNRRAYHRTFAKPTNGFLPEIFIKNENRTIKAGDARISITMRRVMPLEEGMPVEPKIEKLKAEQKSKFKGQMTYSYDGNQHDFHAVKTTIEAIKKGWRTATTRYEDSPSFEYWKTAKVGDIIDWKGANGEIVQTRVTKPLHKLKGSGKTAEQWSELEGWSTEYFNKNVKHKLDKAWQLEYELVYTKPEQTSMTVYQGYDDTLDSRGVNYFAVDELEAATYGENVREVTIDTTNLIDADSKEYQDIKSKDYHNTGKWFNMLDNSPEGLVKQNQFFKLLKEKGHKGINNTMWIDSRYIVTFEDLSIVKAEKEDTNPAEYTNHSGGALGADSVFDTVGKEFGQTSHKHYYYGAKTPKGNVLLTNAQVQEGVVEMNKAAKVLGKKPSKQSTINLLARNWFQVKNADAVFAIAPLENTKTPIVGGGTGWAVAMAWENNKPINVFDTKTNKWFLLDKNLSNRPIELLETPTLTKNFAGIGSRNITKAGKQAIRDVYEKTFTQPQTETYKGLPVVDTELGDVTAIGQYVEYETVPYIVVKQNDNNTVQIYNPTKQGTESKKSVSPKNLKSLGFKAPIVYFEKKKLHYIVTGNNKVISIDVKKIQEVWKNDDDNGDKKAILELAKQSSTESSTELTKVSQEQSNNDIGTVKFNAFKELKGKGLIKNKAHAEEIQRLMKAKIDPSDFKTIDEMLKDKKGAEMAVEKYQLSDSVLNDALATILLGNLASQGISQEQLVNEYWTDITLKSKAVFTYDGVTIDTNFKLGAEQQQALIDVIEFTKDPNKIDWTIEGKAGTGKTTIIGLLERYLKKKLNNRNFTVAYAAPTNSAAAYLALTTAKLGNTTLPATVNSSTREPLDDTDGGPDFNFEFTFKITSLLKDFKNRLYIVDESSMLSNVDIETLKEAASSFDVKLIFMGDAAQIPYVGKTVKKEKGKDPEPKHLASIFSGTNKNKSILTTVYRQKEGPHLDLLSRMHTDTGYVERSVPDHKTIKFQKEEKWQSEYLKDFKEDNDTQKEDTVIIAYTNERVKQLNELVRKKLGKPTITKVGDKVIGYIGYQNKQLTNSDFTNAIKYTITDIQDDSGFQGVKVITVKSQLLKELKKLKVTGVKETTITNYYQLSPNDSLKFNLTDAEFNDNNERVSAIFKKINDLYKEAFKNNAFNWRYFKELAGITHALTRIELGDDYVYDFKINKMVNINSFKKTSKGDSLQELHLKELKKRKLTFDKGIDYGYAITIHKSQGLTVPNVYFDLANTTAHEFLNKTKLLIDGKVFNTEMNALNYVAMSRASVKLRVNTGKMSFPNYYAEDITSTDVEEDNAIDAADDVLEDKIITLPGNRFKVTSPIDQQIRLYDDKDAAKKYLLNEMKAAAKKIADDNLKKAVKEKCNKK